MLVLQRGRLQSGQTDTWVVALKDSDFNAATAPFHVSPCHVAKQRPFAQWGLGGINWFLINKRTQTDNHCIVSIV